MILPLEKLPRIAIMMAAQSSAGAFHLLAPVCSSWTRYHVVLHGEHSSIALGTCQVHG